MALSVRWSDRIALWLIRIALGQAAIGATVLALTSKHEVMDHVPYAQAAAIATTPPTSPDVQAYELSKLEALNIGERLRVLELKADDATATAQDLKTQIVDAATTTDRWLYGLMTTLILQLGATGVMVKGQRAKRSPALSEDEG